MTLKFNKIERGYYATPDGTYAVVTDGYEPVKHVGASKDFNYRTGEGQYEGFQGGEWAAIYDPDGRLRSDYSVGETLEWFSTKREAVDNAQAHADAQARRRTPEQLATVERIRRFYNVHVLAGSSEVVTVKATGSDDFPAVFEVARDGTLTRIS